MIFASVVIGAAAAVMRYSSPAHVWNEALPYLSLAALCLKFEGHDFPSEYRRTLSLSEAVATTLSCGEYYTIKNIA